MSGRIEVAVGAIARRGDTLLLVRRGRGVGAGRWSVPGGRVRFGERVRDALVREVAEETGLAVQVGEPAGWVERLGDDPEPYHYVIVDFHVEVLGDATPRAGDDAAEARWVPVAELGRYDLVDGLAEFLADAGVRPPA